MRNVPDSLVERVRRLLVQQVGQELASQMRLIRTDAPDRHVALLADCHLPVYVELREPSSLAFRVDDAGSATTQLQSALQQARAGFKALRHDAAISDRRARSPEGPIERWLAQQLSCAIDVEQAMLASAAEIVRSNQASHGLELAEPTRLMNVEGQQVRPGSRVTVYLHTHDGQLFSEKAQFLGTEFQAGQTKVLLRSEEGIVMSCTMRGQGWRRWLEKDEVRVAVGDVEPEEKRRI